MEVRLQRESINFYRKLVDTCFNHEETMELIVPDTLPDVMDIVDTDGTVLLRSKEADNGKVTVSGIIRTQIMYTPEGGRGLRNLMVQVPFTVTVDGNDVKPSSKMTVKAELAAVEARAINSRKLIVRADTMLSIQVFSEAELQLSNGIADDTEIEVLKTNTEINPIVDVKEKTFSFSDELNFSSTKPPIGSILKSTARLMPEDIKTVGSKLIIKGSAYITVIYISSGSGEIIPHEFSIPFSQIMELNSEGDNMTFNVVLMTTGLYIQEAGDGANGLAVEISAVAQLIVWNKMNVEYMSDAYSTMYETNSTLGEYGVNSLMSDQTIRDNMRGTISTPNQVRSILGARVYPGRVRHDDGSFKVGLSATIIYSSEDGKIMRAAERFEVTFNSDSAQNYDSAATMQLNEVFASPTAGGVELRIPVELKIRDYANVGISPVSAIEIDEEKPKEVASLPSVVLCRVGANDSLWSLAKRYNSTRDLIRKANLMEEDADISPSELLIIAKKDNRL